MPGAGLADGPAKNERPRKMPEEEVEVEVEAEVAVLFEDR
jgi:hypothetical protein